VLQAFIYSLTLFVFTIIMFRVAACLLALVAARRVERHEHKAKATVEWGATCASLQSSFLERLSAVRETVGTMDAENLSRGTRASITIRMFGIGRAMRRASAMECAWIEDPDNAHVTEAQELVQMLMQQNPCAEAAQAEFASAAEAVTEEQQAIVMQRAMSILASDDCTATEITNEQAPEADEDAATEMTEQAADGCELMVENSNGSGSSFAETNEQYAIERFIRFLIVLAIFVLLVVLCTWVVVWVALFIIQYFTMLLGMIGIYSTIGMALWERLILPPALLACGFDLFHRILDPEIGRLTR
jgi:hypothetical protein